MSTQSFPDLFNEARQRDTYWEERVILEFTEEVYRRMEDLGFTKSQLAERLGTRAAYVTKVLEYDFIKYSIPEKPQSRLQKYRLTEKGRRFMAENKGIP